MLVAGRELGSVDGDPPAMRYTRSALGENLEDILADLEKETADFNKHSIRRAKNP